MAQLSIPYKNSTLESCKPSLMPFHITYNGPAPVSQFMRVEKLQRVGTSSSPVDTANPTPDDDSTGGVKEREKDVPMADAEMVEEGATVKPSLTATSSVATLCDTPTSATPASELSEPTLVPTPSTDSVMSDSTKMESQASLDDIPPLDEMDRRVVAAFRGRAIHGLEIDLPSGYAGLVLLPDPDPHTSSSSSSKKTQASSKPSKTAAKQREPTPEEPTSNRRRGRLTRSAALPKHVVTVEDSEEVVDLSNDTEESTSKSSQWREEQAQRNLTPISTFNSFTLWHADRPVDKDRDEYYRTLNEWIGLAQVIHGCE
ncbi:ribonuclease H2, subunit C [Panaeolus papilionaceus]|nr:ribonuclease H2, subunit C [Panaeolus papilionaceus]